MLNSNLQSRIAAMTTKTRKWMDNIAFLDRSIVETRSSINLEKKQLRINQEAQTVFLEVMKASRKGTVESVETITTDALRYIFANQTLRLKIDIVERRGLEADYLVEWESNGILTKDHPQDAQGGALSDVVSTALRLIFLKCFRPLRRQVLGLDEPGKFLDAHNREAYAKWIQRLAHDLDIQLIIVTHDDELKEIADLTHDLVLNESEEVVAKTTKHA